MKVKKQYCDELIYHRYSKQTNAQPTFLELSLKDGILYAGWNGEIGNAVPFSVWHGVDRRYEIHNQLRVEVINKLIDEIEPLCQIVLDESSTDYNDQCNLVAVLNAKAQKAEIEIQEICNDYGQNDHNLIVVFDAQQYYKYSDIEDKIISALKSGKTQEEIIDLYFEDTDPKGRPLILEGIKDYLNRLTEKIKEDND